MGGIARGVGFFDRGKQMNRETRFLAEWYENDSIDEYEGFMSDISHTQECKSFGAAKTVSKRNAIKHGAMVVGMVTEMEYSSVYGWETTAEYTCEYFNDSWCEWEKQAA